MVKDRRFAVRFSLAAFGAAVIATSSGAAGAGTLTAGDPANTFDLTPFAVGAGSISLGNLTDFRFLPDKRLVMILKTGDVVVRKTDTTLVAAGAFSVSTTSEQGLLGIEVHPDFANNHTLFFYYSASAAEGGTSFDRQRIVSVVLKNDNTLDMPTKKVLATGFMRGPATNDGGALSIGTDGKLYFGVGDSGCNSGAAPGGIITNYFGTCLTNGNGKIMRINLDGTIPNDNPLVGVAAASACSNAAACTAEGTDIATTGTAAPRTEIWAWGFRNPRRFWHDPQTGNLWVGDVGEVTYEEVTIVQKGKHHGWPYREGAHGYPPNKCQVVTPNVGDCVDPVYDCQHGTGTATEDGNCNSITGGLIMDSCDWPATFKGLYFFADNANGRVWTMQPNPARTGLVAGTRKDFGGGFSPGALHTGPDGALYVADYPGTVVRIAPKAPVICPVIPPDAGTEGGANDGGGGSPDGGVGPVDASLGGDSSLGGDAATNAGSGDSGGCGCRVAAAQTTARATWLLAALGALGLFIARRRRAG